MNKSTFMQIVNSQINENHIEFESKHKHYHIIWQNTKTGFNGAIFITCNKTKTEDAFFHEYSEHLFEQLNNLLKSPKISIIPNSYKSIPYNHE